MFVWVCYWWLVYGDDINDSYGDDIDDLYGDAIDDLYGDDIDDLYSWGGLMSRMGKSV